MFGIGMSEMIIILAVALLVFGPDKLPEIAKTISKGLKELRRASDDLRTSVNMAMDDDEPRMRPKPPPPKLDPPVSVPPNIPGSEAAKDLDPTVIADTSSLSSSEDEDPTRGEIWPKPAIGTVAVGAPETLEDKTTVTPATAEPEKKA